MQTALYTPEILEYIVDLLRLDNPDEGTPGRLSLPAVARTCRAFYGPSVDLIWHSLPNLAPLLFTMPSDLWSADNRGRTHTNERVMSFVRPLSPQDYSRFILYAPRVKVIGGFFSDYPRYSCRYILAEDVINKLAAYRPMVSLLPNLQHLDWYTPWMGGSAVSPCIAILVGPHLKSVRLGWSPQQRMATQIVQFLKNLPRATQLEEFSINNHLSHSSLSTIMPVVVCSLRHLAHFHCDSRLTPATLLPLAVLPIQTLGVTFHEGSKVKEEFDGLDEKLLHDAFSMLRDIRLTVDNLSGYTEFLPIIRSRRLSRVRAEARKAPAAAEVEVFFHSLTSHRSHKSIQLVTLEVYTPEPDGPDHMLTPQTFRPLLDLDVKILTVEGCPLAIDDDLLSTMASAWPKLFHLELGVERIFEISPRATLAGIVPLIQRCPNLTILGLVLDTDRWQSAVDLEQRPSQGTVSENIQEINVGNSKISDPVTVAMFLSDLFPNLWWINMSWPSEELAEESDLELDEAELEMNRRWVKARKLAQQFNKVRKQERNWSNGASISKVEPV